MVRGTVQLNNNYMCTIWINTLGFHRIITDWSVDNMTPDMTPYKMLVYQYFYFVRQGWNVYIWSLFSSIQLVKFKYIKLTPKNKNIDSTSTLSLKKNNNILYKFNLHILTEIKHNNNKAIRYQLLLMVKLQTTKKIRNIY